MNEKILVIAAHPDDEILGCGGTIAKKIFQNKAEVYTAIFSKGILSRTKIKNKKNLLINNIKCANLANKLIGVKKLEIFDFPDNEFDSVTRLKIVKKIELLIKKYKPKIIYTHYHGDLNIDHQIISKSVITATRPVHDSSVEAIYAFEVLSSSDYTFGVSKNFQPNHFECIDKFINVKINALKKYSGEMRDDPHSRSINNVINLSKLRGAQMFKSFAEAFVLLKSYSK
ncbi:thiol_BshB1, bacillithiol biosynthesis deacetylase BshB1 [Candidatus Pelagibacterales bacterium]